ncbi:MAG: acyltransferase [Alphaproteobacteria bacterium]|nr:acyltransferase [Alphaproteobacteria bacterium]
MRAAYYRVLCPLYVRRIGAGTQFFGPIRLGRPFSNVTIGSHNMMGYGVFMQTGRASSISIGDHCSINSFCHLVAGERIVIGNNVAIAELVSIRDQEHRFHPDHGVRGQGFDVAPIMIEDNVWIGRGVYIGPGSHIRRGSIVGANSVVRGEFPPNVLIAGAPAVVKKELD